MSKTISIQEAGLGKTLTVDALRLPDLGGGSLDVVPTDSINLVKITVKENGTYRASDFGAYGIAEVRVACTLNGGSATSKEASKSIKDVFNPAPAEGGIARVFACERIKTTLSGGGTCLWVRKGVVALGTKSIDVDNKTYRAADDGYYGYSQVTVSGISITKTTDDDGNEVIEHTDGTGTETMVVPSSIVITRLPDFTGPYGDNAYIGIDGMVVKAYTADGNIWSNEKYPGGVIPNEEITFDPIVTTYDPSKDGIKSDYDGQSMYCRANSSVTITSSSAGSVTYRANSGEGPFYTYGAYAYSERLHTGYTGGYVCSAKPFDNVRPAYPVDGRPVYIEGRLAYQDSLGPVTVDAPINDITSIDNTLVAWIACYGEHSESGCHQTVTISWPRPMDNQVLQTSFEVTVVDVGPMGGQGED